MSTLATIRAAIVAKALTVPGFGIVHDRERYMRDEGAFRRLYVTDLDDGRQQLRGWNLRRQATTELGIAIGRGADVHTWQLRGYMALADEEGTELVFDELIEAFRDAVRADPTFGGVCEPDAMSSGGEAPQYVQVLDSGPVMFCGVLCHSALLQLRTWSYHP